MSKESTPQTDEENTPKKIKCTICLQDTYPYHLAVYENLEFFSCQECGSIYASPKPTKEYNSDALNDSYYANRSVFPDNREKKHFLKHLEDLKTMTKGRKFLELNCRNGYRTELARMNGFKEALGVDTNTYCLEVANVRYPKSATKKAPLEDIAKTGETYDIIYDAHGAEQAMDIDTYMENIKKLMHKKTLVYFMLCDGNHLMVPNSFLNWEEVIYPERLRYISKEGFEEVLQRHGLEIKKRYFRFLPYQHVIAKLKK